ncbi:MAG: StlD/DarB family beta-ketosynthase [Gammaproteobacteria bacterium]|nr:MAG: StlD/DarB family beta-ketosynthase [Gammaproteobacteria bacterium]
MDNTISAYITNVAAFMPNDPVSNDEMENILGMVGGKPSRAKKIILKSNGIETRYYVLDPKTRQAVYTNAELAALAIKNLEGDSFSVDEIECLSSGTTMPDQMNPGHAVMVHGELKNPPCEVISTAGICLAGLTSLKYAYLSVLSGDHENAVATGSEAASPHFKGEYYQGEIEEKVNNLDKRPELAFEKDFLRWMLSDGAGAVLIENTPNKGKRSLKIEWIDIYSYANEIETCMYTGAQKQEDGSLVGWREFSNQEWYSDNIMAIKQDVKLLNENIVDYCIEKTINKVIAKRGLKPEDIDYFLPHISSEYFRSKILEKLEEMNYPIPEEKWFTNLNSKGNTGSASIYIILDELFNSGKLKAGERLLCFVPESGRFSSGYMLLTVV